jgi:hypothetical protein
MRGSVGVSRALAFAAGRAEPIPRSASPTSKRLGALDARGRPHRRALRAGGREAELN